ncbi:type II secretion system F family protein [Kitasatospora sp. NBC_01287]|uniref:type II secretion system F family protein n=1 Tax=Kitasatospora sp. NBC_01287 TaxID=2903573 RepID=UPI002259B9A3|nr:type II secretion system F family protein [Kitasatospora sp. NBC_01287]MCX4748126.1 type II secretion system F family protein [Kitasatospora sp. NBC_01287]
MGVHVPPMTSALLPLVVLAGAFTPIVLLMTFVGRRLRGRAGRRRAARLGLEEWCQGEREPLPRRSTAAPLVTARRGTAASGDGAGGRFRPRVGPVLPALLGLVIAAAFPHVVGLVAGVMAALLVRHWLLVIRSPDRRSAREQELLMAQLPLTAELLAACLGSSASPAQAAEAVARTIGDPMRARLTATSAQLELGTPPAACWERLGDECPALAPLARCLVRTTVSGAPPAAPLAGLALAQRAAAGRAAHARVRRAGVLATAPLGLCFLPAFVLIGVVPVVVGLAASFTQRL